MTDWRRQAVDALRAGEPSVAVVVDQVRGSAPREAGTVMIVSRDKCFGTIGGGQLEHGAIATARDLLQNASASSIVRRIPLGSDCGQCCGGVVTLSFTRREAREATELENVLGRAPLDIVIFGAGHVGRALAQVLCPLDANVMVIDGREEQLALLPHGVGQPLLAVDPVAAIDLCPTGAAVVVMTHDHDLDLSLCSALLQRDHWRFLGLIGSRTKARRFRKKLLASGLSERTLESLTCPIGLPMIDGKHPGEIAISVAAQVLKASQSAVLEGVA
ncbi:MAG: xanthine dehydrogenase accessory protein XdhC [Pseudomonadota bacterium]